MTNRYTVLPSPVGDLLLTGSPEGLTGLYLSPRAVALGADWRRDDAAFAEPRRQLSAYFAGELTTFDLPLAPVGSPFRHRVWAELRTIPYAETRSYGAIAAAIGAPGAARAVGLANGRNPISIIVPCHRVIGGNGRLIGYGGGVENKRILLALEARHRPLLVQ